MARFKINIMVGFKNTNVWWLSLSYLKSLDPEGYLQATDYKDWALITERKINEWFNKEIKEIL